MKTLKLAAVAEHFSAPWRYAQENNLFNKIEVNLDFRECKEGTGAMCQDLQDGSIDLAVLLTEGAIKHMVTKGGIKIIAPFVETPLNWGVFVKAEATINSVQELENKTIAISRYGSGSHLMTYLLAQQQGWDLKALKFKVAGGLDKLCQSLNENASDAFLWEIFTTKPKTDKGLVRMLGNIETPWPCFCIVAREEVAAQHSAKLKDLITLVLNAWHEFLSDKNAAIAFIAKTYSLQKQDVAIWIETVRWASSDNVDSQMLAEVKNTLQSLGLLNQ